MGYEPVTVREAAELEVLLFVALAFVGGLLVVYWGFQTYQFGRIIRDTPPEPIRSVAMGRTEISGEIQPATRVYDQPFTPGQCVYGELEVEEYRDTADDDNDKQWKTVQTESFSTPFYIDDGTGEMLVDPGEDTIYEISEEHSVTVEVGGGDAPTRSSPGVSRERTRRRAGLGRWGRLREQTRACAGPTLPARR
jgi:E3 Ubiquitin ligase.